MGTVATELSSFVSDVLRHEPEVTIRFWDGSALGEGPAQVLVRSPRALRRILYAPGELGFARAYVAGDIDIEGDISEILHVGDRMTSRRGNREMKWTPRTTARLIATCARLGAIGPPLRAPREEARLRGRVHSRQRDAAAIAHHYDVGNDFYRLVLGDTMTYSCAYFADDRVSLDEAQLAKYELICRKLGLEPGMRLLDVGCGWGGMALHAAEHHGALVVGITLSGPQADLAAKRVADAGLADRVEIRYQDYRDVSDGPFDAISSIGMFEHVGLRQLERYFQTLHGLLGTGGRLLNHAISRPFGPPGFDRGSFVYRYVFPDGELQEVGSVVSAMQRYGLEVRDVESLREHYARTLRTWVSRLEARWDEAVALVGLARAKIWRLYMAGSAVSFDAGRINVHQVLGVRPSDIGKSAMPPTRTAFLTAR